MGQLAPKYPIEQDSSYRNVLIILTDGYMYHENSKDTIKNRSAYIERNYLNRVGLRNNSNWEVKFEEEDFGFITKRDNLNKLEILVLEISPSENHLNDEDIIKKYWEKWFKEMNVKRFSIHTTGLPVHTKRLIESFMRQN